MLTAALFVFAVYVAPLVLLIGSAARLALGGAARNRDTAIAAALALIPAAAALGVEVLSQRSFGGALFFILLALTVAAALFWLRGSRRAAPLLFWIEAGLLVAVPATLTYSVDSWPVR